MAKGVHNKTHKRNQGIKRKVIWEQQGKKNLDNVNARLMKRCYGAGDDEYITLKKSAFRYPKDPEAAFPKHPEPIYIDKRSRACNATFLERERGMRDHNIKRHTHNEALKSAYKGINPNDNVDINIEDNENNVIDLNKINGDKMDLSEDVSVKKAKKVKKAKIANDDGGMEIDVDGNKSVRKLFRKVPKQKKKKSYYIVNY